MKLKLFLILLLCSASLSYGQTKKDADKQAIANLIQSSFDGIWSTLDPRQIENYYTWDFLLLEDGEVWNNDSVAKYLKIAQLQEPAPKRINHIDIIDIKISSETAWVAYRNRAIVSVEGVIVRRAEWIESATAIRTYQGWKLDMLHSTRIKND